MPAAVRPEDVAFNRVSVALARSQSLVASWLPPRPAEDAAAQRTSEQLHHEETALFTPGSDILGVGAEPPKEIADGSFKRNQLSSNDRLRQQLLGKHAAKGRAIQPADNISNAPAHLPTKKLEKPNKGTRVQEDSDDEENGRAAMFRSKRKAAPAPVNKHESMGDSDSESEVKGKVQAKQEAPAVQEKTRKRPVSYLDELLEERSKKKSKKQKAQADQAGTAVKTGTENNPHKEEKSQATPVAEKRKSQQDDDSSDDLEGETSNAAQRQSSKRAHNACG
ncbi:hypothetical protein B0J12DRAFT_701101 [Macrophomina phaseolina]|uniref:Uncharacterized protein n=1 Tax=Macrophomina phaseolina TaxID=35725 RepID=A0ABQ8G679_9PEZI|nr:hypothetical protein B0J12DRAFT_701101 [Macrophomina phaseolina]